MVDRGLFGLDIGRGFSAGGVRAGSIFQGETLSGRGIVEVSSHLTLKEHEGHFNMLNSSLTQL